MLWNSIRADIKFGDGINGRRNNKGGSGTTRNAITEIWPKNYNRMIGNPENSEKRADWSPQSNPNAHSPAFVFTNRRINDEIKGGGNTTVNDGSFFRFVIAMKYPDGVSQEEGEKWFYESFIPAMKKQKDLLRGFSYKGIEPHVKYCE